MTEHVLSVDLWYSGGWQPVPAAQVHETAGVTTNRGYTAERTIRPGEVRLRILDDALTYDPDNPLSPLFGLIGVRTLVRVTVDGVAAATCEVASWSAGASDDWDPGPPVRGFRFVDVTAAGLLSRIAGWSRTLISPMRRQLAAVPGMVGYWPCEDTKSSGSLSNLLPGGPAAPAAGVNLQSATPPGGSGPLLTLSSGGLVQTQFVPAPTTGQWQVGWCHSLSGVTLTATPTALVSWYTSRGHHWTWWVSSTTWTLEIRDQADTVITTVTQAVGANTDPKVWQWVRCAAVWDGANTTVTMAMHTEGTPGFTGWSKVYASAVSPGWLTTGFAATADLDFGHFIGVYGSAQDLMDAQTRAAFAGHPGEPAGVRFGRLCTQEQVPYRVVGDPAATEPMGPQGVDALIDLLKLCVDTDDALLYEGRSVSEVVMRTRRSCYAPPVLTLTWPAQVGRPFAPVTDALAAATVVTVKQADGSGEASASVSGVDADAAPEKRDVTVSAASALALPQLAAWYLNRYAGAGARYPQLVLDCDATPAHAVVALEPGDLVQIDGYRPAPVLLQALGVGESVYAFRRTRTLATVDGAVWNAGRYDAPGSRYDVPACTLSGPLDASQTTVQVSCADPFGWWSSAAPPYRWSIGAETVRVDVITAATGTTAPRLQTATVTRGVNGVFRAHPAGEVVRLADPVRYGR